MARKGYSSSNKEKIIYDNTVFRGVSATTDPNPEGYFKQLINFDISDTGQSLQPRKGFMNTVFHTKDDNGYHYVNLNYDSTIYYLDHETGKYYFIDFSKYGCTPAESVTTITNNFSTYFNSIKNTIINLRIYLNGILNKEVYDGYTVEDYLNDLSQIPALENEYEDEEVIEAFNYSLFNENDGLYHRINSYLKDASDNIKDAGYFEFRNTYYTYTGSTEELTSTKLLQDLGLYDNSAEPAFVEFGDNGYSDGYTWSNITDWFSQFFGEEGYIEYIKNKVELISDDDLEDLLYNCYTIKPDYIQYIFMYKVDLTQIDKTSKYFILEPITDYIVEAKPEEDIIYLQDYLGVNYTNAVLQTIKPVGSHRATYIKDGMLIDRNIIKVECKLLDNNVPTISHQFWLEFKYNDTSDEMLLTVVNTDDTKDLLERNIASPKSVIPDPIAKIYATEEAAFNDGVTYSKFPMMYKYKDIANSDGTTTRKYLINYTDNLEGLTIAPSFYLLPPKTGYRWMYTFDIYSTSNLITNNVNLENNEDLKKYIKYEAPLFDLYDTSYSFIDVFFESFFNYANISTKQMLKDNYGDTLVQHSNSWYALNNNSNYDKYTYYSYTYNTKTFLLADNKNIKQGHNNFNIADINTDINFYKWRESLLGDYIIYIVPKKETSLERGYSDCRYVFSADSNVYYIDPIRLIQNMFSISYKANVDSVTNDRYYYINGVDSIVKNYRNPFTAETTPDTFKTILNELNTITTIQEFIAFCKQNENKFDYYVENIKDVLNRSITDKDATLYNNAQTALTSGVLIWDKEPINYETLYNTYLQPFEKYGKHANDFLKTFTIRPLYSKAKCSIHNDILTLLHIWYRYLVNTSMSDSLGCIYKPEEIIQNLELFFPNLFSNIKDNISDETVYCFKGSDEGALFSLYTDDNELIRCIKHTKLSPNMQGSQDDEDAVPTFRAKSYYVYTCITSTSMPQELRGSIYNGYYINDSVHAAKAFFRNKLFNIIPAVDNNSISSSYEYNPLDDIATNDAAYLDSDSGSRTSYRIPSDVDGSYNPTDIINIYFNERYTDVNAMRKLDVSKFRLSVSTLYIPLAQTIGGGVTAKSFDEQSNTWRITANSICDNYYKTLQNDVTLNGHPATIFTTDTNHAISTVYDTDSLTPQSALYNELYNNKFFDNGISLVLYLMQVPTEAYIKQNPTIDILSIEYNRSLAVASTNLFNSTQIQLKENADNDDSNIIDEALDGADEDPALINKCTEWCIFNSLEGYRLVIWSKNNVYMSEAGDYNYFKSANKKVYPEPVVKVLAFKDMLLVFTTQNMYSIFPYEITEQVQDGTDDEGNPKYVQQKRTVYNTLPVLYNLYTDERYKDVIQVYNGMILFYSADGQLYLISPSTQIDTDTQFTLKYINKSVNDVLLNYDKYINERLNLYYNTHDFEYVTKNKNNDNEYDVVITASVSISNIKIYYTVPKYTYTYILIYDITNNRYTIYDTATFGTAQSILQTNMYDLVIAKSPSNTLSAVIPYTEPNVTDNNCDLTTVDNYTFIQHDIMTELDTGIIYLNNQWKKRFRSLQTTYKNIDANDLLFNLDVIVDDIFISSTMGDTLVLKNIDASNREDLYYIAEDRDERADLVRNPNVKEEDLVKNIPVNKITPSEFLKNNQKLFDFSSYSSNKIITHYTNIPSLGKHIELRLRFNSKGKYKLQGFTLVYKEHSV